MPQDTKIAPRVFANQLGLGADEEMGRAEMIERTRDLLRVEARVQRIQDRAEFEQGICCNRKLYVIP